MRARTSYLPAAAGLAAVGLVLLDQSRKRTRNRAQHYLDELTEAALRDVHVRLPLGTAVLGLAALAGGGYLLSKQLRRGPGDSHTVQESIELDVPVSTAYNQWTQFEDFPKFMASVESVTQIDDTHLHWRAMVGGKVKEWDAEITEQIPDERIAWRSIGGVDNAGVVTFHKISDSRTRVMLQMDYQPETAGEKMADAAGAVKLTTKGNLKRFKDLLESRGQETGAWRGAVTQH
jgi:uncharacterized membrane protein